jgi:hypothetical protein
MKARFCYLFACIFLLSSALALAQEAPCTTHDDTAYTQAIKKFTTEPYFSTELVDHLPFSSCVPAPDTFLGHIVGAPDVLDYTKQINAYLRLLASKSPRVKVFSLGRSEEGREMLLVAVADEATIANLDHYREITARLADPRHLSEGDAQALVAQGKPMYWACGSIHSPETGSPEMLMELAYRLVVEDTPLIDTIRKSSIVLLTPVVETDGHDRYVDIYMHGKRHPQDLPYPLTWWGHYVSHDNNRDALTLSLALSKNMMNGFLDWHVTVFHDLHESIPYLYISTGTGPYNAWLDPLVTSEWQQMAYYEIEELTKRGVIGVWTHGFYDGWAPNYMFYLANGHNSIGRFYETFGNEGADTMERELGPSDTSRDWFRPNPPLPKVKWSARDNANMEQSGVLLGMYNLATHGQEYLQNFYAKSRRAVEKARREGPAAWVLPGDEPRTFEQARLLNMLVMQGVEVSRADKAFTVSLPADSTKGSGDDKHGEKPDEQGKESAGQKPADKGAGGASADSGKEAAAKKTQPFPAGSYIIRMDQPYSRLADMLLDTQYYSTRDPRSYDDTGWTMGALANVKTVRVMDTGILDVAMTKVPGKVMLAGSVSGAGGTVYLIDHNASSALGTFRYRLASVSMEAAEDSFEAGGHKFSRGAFIIAGGDRAEIENAARDLGLAVYAVAEKPKVATHPLEAPRVAIVHNWESTQNDGWFRISMDEMKIPYTYVADTKIRETANLREQFEAIILPPGNGDLASRLKGIPMLGNPLPWKNTDEMPNLFAPGLDTSDDIRGGLGYAGLENLERFVKEGGLLVAVGGAASLPINGGITDMVALARPQRLICPGSVLLANVEDQKSPIAYGYGPKLFVYYRSGTLLRVETGFGGFGGFGGGGEGGGASRASGRGSATDPDVIQGRTYMPPEKAPKRTPREEELYISDEMRHFMGAMIPPANQFPRVILRFAEAKDLLYSGELDGAPELAEKPAVVDVPHGQGHVLLFATNPMWRNETSGSFALLFNALMNYRALDAGRLNPPPGQKR